MVEQIRPQQIIKHHFHSKKIPTSSPIKQQLQHGYNLPTTTYLLVITIINNLTLGLVVYQPYCPSNLQYTPMVEYFGECFHILNLEIEMYNTLGFDYKLHPLMIFNQIIQLGKICLSYIGPQIIGDFKWENSHKYILFVAYASRPT